MIKQKATVEPAGMTDKGEGLVRTCEKYNDKTFLKPTWGQCTGVQESWRLPWLWNHLTTLKKNIHMDMSEVNISSELFSKYRVVILAVDIRFVNVISYLVSPSQHINFITIVMIKSQNQLNW